MKSAKSTDQYNKKITDLLSKLDKNNDGVVSIKELKAALSNEVVNGEMEKNVFSPLNSSSANGDSQLNFEKFLRFVKDRQVQLKLAFKQFDRNEDNIIGADDIQMTMKELGVNIGLEEAEKLLTRIDKDNNLCIDYAEWKNYLLLSTARNIDDILKMWQKATGIDLVETIADNFTLEDKLKHLATKPLKTLDIPNNNNNNEHESTEPSMTSLVKIPPPRKQKISLTDKERLVNAYLNGDDPIELGRLLGIKCKRTIYNIIYRFNKNHQLSTGKIGGHKKHLITEQISESLFRFLESSCSATLVEMQTFLKNNHQIQPSTQTISNYLKGKLITIKTIRNSVVDRNCPRVKEIRRDYVTRLLHERWKSSQCIYIDESSFQVFMSKKHGRSKRAEVIYRKVPSIRIPHVSLILAICKKGPVHFQVQTGAVNREVYQSFVTELSLKLPNTKHYLIHDNAAIHGSTISTTELHEIVNLPPYSPFLNPIETFFSQVKGKVRSLMTKNPNYLTMSNSARTNLVKETVAHVLADTSLCDTIKNHFGHIKKYFPECILQEEIL